MPKPFSSTSSRTFNQNVLAHYRNIGHSTSINMATSRLRSSWKSRWWRYIHQVLIHSLARSLDHLQQWPQYIDPPIKQLAQWHMYLGTNVIANRNLGLLHNTQIIIQLESGQKNLPLYLRVPNRPLPRPICTALALAVANRNCSRALCPSIKSEPTGMVLIIPLCTRGQDLPHLPQQEVRTGIETQGGMGGRHGEVSRHRQLHGERGKMARMKGRAAIASGSARERRGETETGSNSTGSVMVYRRLRVAYPILIQW